MTRPGLHDGGRVATPARTMSSRTSLKTTSRVALILASSATLLGAASCTPHEHGTPSGGPDAAVTFRSALTSPATWQNLWGSWPASRYDHGSAYDIDRSTLVVFGGRAGANGPYFSDTWEWNSARGAWNERTPSSGGPAERTGHVMVYDTARKKTFLFSGWQPAAGFYIPEQWEWDGPTATWKQILISGAQPKERYGATMVWDPDRARAVLFGGFCYDSSADTAARCNDIWEWDGTTTTWTNRTPTGTSPSPRMFHSMTYDSTRKKMVLYGGYTGTGVATTGTWVDETWEWDGGTGAWTKMTPTAGIPYYSSDIHIAYDAGRNKVVAYYYYQYMWEYDPTTPTWTAVTTPTKTDNDTPSYEFGTFLYDPSRSKIVVYGGEYGTSRDIYEYSGVDGTWANRSVPVSGPIQRTSPQIAYDNMSGKLYLFGGYSSSDALYKQDTWQWSGTDATWTNLTNANAKPTGRELGGMVYDSKRDQLLLFGGVGQTYYNDIWSWSPTTRNWTQVTISGTTMPAVTSSALSMFYDPARDKVLVYINYATIWQFDPATSAWVQRAVTANAPTALTQRGNAEVTFDSDRGKILLIGGYGYVAAVGDVYDSDVWEWDTTTAAWTERPPATGATVPPARVYHVASYDTARRVVVMFGGYEEVTGVPTVALNDSWEWDGIGGTWSETTPAGVKPLPRYNQLQVFDSQRATTLVFGGTVPADTTYGPQEIWEYQANNSPRPNGSGCSSASASTCASGFCVDGVCCASASCTGTCQACDVTGNLGTCSNVPAGSPDDSCASDQACDANQQCKARIGHLCGAYTDCASGHCADGVCCNTDCNDTCKVCNLNSSLGTCALVPTGNEDPGTCVSDSTQPRYCDATGVCANAAKAAGSPCTASGQCASTYCIDGYCCSSPCTTTCYSCGLPATLGSCQPIPAGLPDHSATTTCDGAMQYCTGAGTCGMNKYPNGQTCTANTDCGSGFCVDGKCCNSACTGTCQSCAVAGSLGSCVNLPAGAQDPTSSPACGGAQYCDPNGTCQSGLKVNGATCAAGTECGSAHCIDGVCCDSACGDTCYACNLAGSIGTCTGVATGGTDSSATTACAAPNFCTATHTCTAGKKPNGATCAADTDCGSSYCVDGTCCESACGTACHSCNNAAGTCVLTADGLDPRNNCKGQGICTGTCNGQGTCRFGPQGTVCAAAGCQTDTNLITSGGACDGAGNCAQTVSTPCNGFGCFTDTNGAAQCKTDCATDPDCSIKRYCLTGADGGSGSQCPAAKPGGAVCTHNTECLNDTCAIAKGETTGVCCNIACDQCGSCNTAGSVGTCIPIPAGTDPNGDCMDSASDPTHQCGGMCDGHAHCLYPQAGATCGTCKACNGAGLCNVAPADDTACGNIDCSELTTSCLQYHDLTVNRCASIGTCKAPNLAASCTDVTNVCGAGGAGGAGGGGGSTGTDGSVDGGKPKGSGGGGCGCDLGGTDPLTVLPALLLLAGLVTARRRRR